MDRVASLQRIAELFSYRTIPGEVADEFVVFSQSQLKEGRHIKDKTAFEAIENHIHLLDDLSKDEFKSIDAVAQAFITALHFNLKAWYPQRKFAVYATASLGDSFILRFHQLWEGEAPYYCPDDYDGSREKVFAVMG